MRIIFDFLSVKTDLLEREFSKSWIQTIRNLYNNRGLHDVYIVLNANCLALISAFKFGFDIGQVKIIKIPFSESNLTRTKANSFVRELFYSKVSPDIVVEFVNSLDSSIWTSGPRKVSSNLPWQTVFCLHCDQNSPWSIDGYMPSELSKHQIGSLENLNDLQTIFVFGPAHLEKLVLGIGGSPSQVRLIGRSNRLGEVQKSCSNMLGDEKAIQNEFYNELEVIVSGAKVQCKNRPPLAFVSPLPPAKSGISYYSMDLLPELSCFYDIEVITDQPAVEAVPNLSNFKVRSVAWFFENGSKFDRIIYHFGNSGYHSNIFDLFDVHPGIVVLHDFYLGHAAAFKEKVECRSGYWTKVLYESHGYSAIKDRVEGQSDEHIAYQYPCSYNAVVNSIGLIVHSHHALQLAEKWYGSKCLNKFAVLPLLRTQPQSADKGFIRKSLGLEKDDFVICSFGMLVPTKQNHRLISSFLKSDAVNNKKIKLIFVGEQDQGDYGDFLTKQIAGSIHRDRIKVIGWVDIETLHKYLAIADLAVQLRTNSRGETSAAVLDCMGYGIATIVNANGSMGELPQDAVYMIPDNFDDFELAGAIDKLSQDEELRIKLGICARRVIGENHDPAVCARKYYETIENNYAKIDPFGTGYFNSVSMELLPEFGEQDLITLSQAIAHNNKCAKIGEPQQLFIDVSVIMQSDGKTGIQRVVRAILLALIESPLEGFRIEPVYFSDMGGRWHFRYARKFTIELFGGQAGGLSDEPISYRYGDKLFCLDFTGDILVEANRGGVFDSLRECGVEIQTMVYDILPILQPQFFPEYAHERFTKWLEVVCKISDRIICISEAVASEVKGWLNSANLQRSNPLDVSFVHLGADIEMSAPTTGLPGDAFEKLRFFEENITFIMVGTIEPRKGHLQVIEAFERLWAAGKEELLVIVGKEGWKGVEEGMRRTIPKVIEKIQSHPELGKRLFWLEAISDEYLELIYSKASCLIAASEAEGFGLPLIEAAQRNVPLLIRDIPVFREIAGDSAFYFKGLDPDSLAEAINQWLQCKTAASFPASNQIKWLTWDQCADKMKATIGRPQYDSTSAI